jgi:putative ABC transport system permease protein
MPVRFLPYVLKTLWRHRARTILTVGGSAVGLFLFCFVSSILEGLNHLESEQQQSAALVVFQANKFCPATSHLPQDYDAKIRKVAGVRDVVPIQVYTNNCRASLDVVVFYGVVPADLLAARELQVTRGSWDAFEKRTDGALVGIATAQRRGLKPGDKFSIGDLSVVVAGIFECGDRNEENYVYAHLEFLQRSKSRNLVGSVTQFEVLCDPAADANAVCRAIDDLFRGGPVATDTRPKGVFQAHALGDLMQMINLSQWLGLASVALVLMLVATTTLMSVDDRSQEYAVLKTIGVTHRQVFGLVLAESTLLGLMGGLIGVLAAAACLYWGRLSIGAEAVAIAFVPTPALLLRGLAVAVGSALAAGLAPALFAGRAEIVPALRQLQ